MLGRSTRPGSRRGAAVVSAPEPRPESGSALRGSPASDCAPSGSACLTALCPPHCRRVRMRTAGLAPAPEDSNRRPPCETQTSIQLVLKTGALKNEGKDRSFYTKRTFLRFQAAPACPPPPDSVPRHVVGAGGTLSLSHPGACTPEEPRCCRQRGAFRPPAPDRDTPAVSPAATSKARPQAPKTRTCSSEPLFSPAVRPTSVLLSPRLENIFLLS